MTGTLAGATMPLLERLVRRFDDTPDMVFGTIWKDLLARYDELKKDRERVGVEARVAVLGRADARPDEVFQALFGVAAGSAARENDEATWEVHATFDVDALPGGGKVGATGDDERALTYLRESDAIFLTLLPGRRPTELEAGLYDHIRRLRRVHCVVVHQPADQPAEPSSRDAASAAWVKWEFELRRDLNDRDLTSFQVQGLATKDLVRLARHVNEKFDPRLRLSFLRMLKHHGARNALVVDMINGTSRTAAVLGLNPIPYADIIAITPVQVLLVCRVAAAHGRPITVRWAKDFLSVCGLVLGAGWGFKGLYRAIKSGLLDPSLPLQMSLGAAVAWIGTQVIGHAARIYFQTYGSVTIKEAAERAARLVLENAPSE